MDELVSTDFFGFVPDQLYQEVYAIGYNEFLAAVSSLREVLLQEFPDKEEEVERGCGHLLVTYEQQFDQRWFARFLQYCSKNIFTVPRHVPVYDEDLGREGSEGAHAKLQELRHRIMAVEYLNAKLHSRLKEMDGEIKMTEALLVRVRETERRQGVLEKARELERQLQEIVGRPEDQT